MGPVFGPIYTPEVEREENPHPSQGFRCAADAACAIHDHAHCNPSQGFARASPGHIPPRLRTNLSLSGIPLRR